MPALPGADAVEAADLLRYCPVCDGYEHTGKRIGVIGNSSHGVKEAAFLKVLVVNVRHGLQLVQATAPQLTKPQRWFALVRYIVERILACAPKPNLGLTALRTEQLRKMG